MLIQQTPFRDFDHLFDRLTGGRSTSAVPMDAYRRNDDVWVQLDLPGIDADSLDITVERSVLTVTAERSWKGEDGDQTYLAERPTGTFRRQVHLGEGLDPERIEASYVDGVLTLQIPVAERAKPRRIDVTVKGSQAETIETTAS